MEAMQLELGEARCRIWWEATPVIAGERSGLIGNYEAADNDAASAILDLACERLREHGATLALGPIDGSTWHRYRWVAEGSAARAPYFLEPANPAFYVDRWQAAGFAPYAWYQSAVYKDFPVEDPRVERVWQRLEAQGFRLRPVDMDRWDEELGALYQFSLEAFADNFLYTPIGEAEFRGQYATVRPFVHPGLVWVVEKQIERPLEKPVDLCAFLFAIPDHREAAPVRTVVIKTVASHPRYRRHGLGSILTWHAHRVAREHGYAHAIHALMYEENESTRISGRLAEVFRRYALYARRLV